MRTSVIIPWAPSDAHRRRALDFVLARLNALGLPVFLGELTLEEPWSKALAVREGLTHGDSEVIAIHDADVLCDGLLEAIEQVHAGVARWAIPHRRVVRLNEEATADVLAGAPFESRRVDRRPYTGVAAGGVVVMRRDCYLDAPLDPRFVGWGHEDLSAAHMWRCLHGQPWRGTADLWHLWHPPQRKISPGVGSRNSTALYQRYAKAAHDPVAMRRLVTEGREVLRSEVVPRDDLGGP